MIHPLPFAAAYILDLLLGDPRRIPHPVEVIGWCIRGCEGSIRRHTSHLRLGGVLLWMTIVALSCLAASLLQTAAYMVHTILGTAVVIYGSWTTLATRSLYDQSRAVVVEIEGGNLQEARRKLSMIVGRDTKDLNREEILQAIVETLAENLSDGVIAPLIYLFLGGFPLAFAYKAINTLDSMVGHRDEHYREIGWFSAKADDIANWVPARLTGLLITVISFGLVLNGRNAWRIMRRDGRKHLSPNSGIPEAAMAGALSIQLGGNHHYFGKLVKKPTIGDMQKKIETGTVKTALRVISLSSLFMASLCLTGLTVLRYD